MVTEVHCCQPWREESGKLTSEHPTPGIVLFKQLIEPIQLRLIKLCVVNQPLLVLGQQANGSRCWSSAKHCQ